MPLESQATEVKSTEQKVIMNCGLKNTLCLRILIMTKELEMIKLNKNEERDF